MGRNYEDTTIRSWILFLGQLEETTLGPGVFVGYIAMPPSMTIVCPVTLAKTGPHIMQAMSAISARVISLPIGVAAVAVATSSSDMSSASGDEALDDLFDYNFYLEHVDHIYNRVGISGVAIV